MMNNFRIVKHYGGNGGKYSQGKMQRFPSSHKRNSTRQQTIEEYYSSPDGSSIARGSGMQLLSNRNANPRIQSIYKSRSHRQGSMGNVRDEVLRSGPTNIAIDEDLWSTANDLDENWPTQPVRKNGPPYKNLMNLPHSKTFSCVRENDFRGRKITSPGYSYQENTSYKAFHPYNDSTDMHHYDDEGKFPDFGDFFQDENEEFYQQPPSKKQQSISSKHVKPATVHGEVENGAPILKPLDENFPRMFTVSVAKLQTWIENGSTVNGEILFEMFGIFDSSSKNSQLPAKHFVIKGQQKGKVNCTFYEMDRTLTLDNTGKWQRCVGLLRKGAESFQCLSIRSATADELRVLDRILSANSRALAIFLRTKL